MLSKNVHTVYHRFKSERPIIPNEYELHESYPESIRSQSRASKELKEMEADLECTIYGNHMVQEEDESEKKE